MSMTKKIEYQSVVRDILDNEEFKKLYLEPHHGISRYLHVLRVSKIAFGFCKIFKVKRIREITRSALLHDFYFDKDLEGMMLMKD